MESYVDDVPLASELLNMAFILPANLVTHNLRKKGHGAKFIVNEVTTLHRHIESFHSVRNSLFSLVMN